MEAGSRSIENRLLCVLEVLIEQFEIVYIGFE